MNTVETRSNKIPAMLTFLSAAPLAGRTVAPLPEDVREGCMALLPCVGDGSVVGFVPGLVGSDFSGDGDIVVSIISVVSIITVSRVPEISVVMAIVVVIAVVVTNVVVVDAVVVVVVVIVEEIVVEEAGVEEDEDDPGTIIKGG